MCLDEIQLISGWETFVRRLLDTENVRLFVSGSSSKMLSREVASALRGRALETVIWPFSFNEYLRHLGIEYSAKPGFWPARELSRLESAFGQYLRAKYCQLATQQVWPICWGSGLISKEPIRMERSNASVNVVRL